MCAKKKAIPGKMWRIAGEPICSQPLTATELRRLFKDAFFDYIDRALEIQGRLRFRQAEREKDALANLNVLTAIVMACAARHLPWAQDDFDARAGLFERGRPDYRMRYEYCGADEDGKIDQDSPPDWLVSEAQLFYIATGVVPPRNQQPSKELIRWFTNQGVAEPRARELAFGAMFAYYSGAGGHGWKDIDWFFESSDGPEEVTEDAAAPVPISDAPNKVEALVRQVKELRAALHDAERAAGRLKEQLRMAEQKGEADREELARLRETLYDLRGGEASETMDSGPLVELPWQVKRRVVVFGGHDSWRKAVKPLLPGARFYDREILPDINAIRGADVVWLQVNAFFWLMKAIALIPVIFIT